MLRQMILIFVISLCAEELLLAQQSPTPKDSSNLYENIHSYSRRSKFTKFIYRIIFRPIKSGLPKKSTSKKSKKKLVQKPYSRYEGKIIRKINIETLDPFGYTVADTIFESQNKLSKFGNSLQVQ